MLHSSEPSRSPLLLTRTATFVAVGVVAGLALSAVPNVELVTAVCFSAGFLLGPAGGLLTGALTETLYAGFHPLGSSLGILLAAQIAGMIIAGLSGAAASVLSGPARTGFRWRIAVVGLGTAATLVFDLLTNLAFPVAAGFSPPQTLLSLTAAVPFALLHLASNLLVFTLIVVPLLPRLERILGSS